MDSTQDFVEKMHEKQRSNEQSKKRQGKQHAGHQLPNKQHSTNK